MKDVPKGVPAGELAAAGAIAGAVSGGMGAALAGGSGGDILKGAAMGAAAGAAMGGITGSFAGAGDRAVAGVIMAAASGGAAYATGGTQGLMHFGAGLAGSLVGGYGMEWLLDPDYVAMAAEIRSNATPNQRAMGDTIYGEAGGNYRGNYDDKLGVGYTMKTRYEAGQGSYQEIADAYYAPRYTLKPARYGQIVRGELNDFQASYRAAAEVLNASPGSNPFPRVTLFHDRSIGTPWTGVTEVQYGSGRLRWYRE